MELYERILNLIELFENNSQTSFAKKIGIAQATFWGYLNKDGQSKIKLTQLKKILEAYPSVNRMWLFFGEGDPLVGQQNGTTASRSQTVQETNEASSKVRELESELQDLREELLDAQRKIIRLQEELLKRDTDQTIADSVKPESPAARNTSGQAATPANVPYAR